MFEYNERFAVQQKISSKTVTISYIWKIFWLFWL